MTTNISMSVLVMAGGKGTRFWPESIEKKPKQYLSLTGGQPLITETLMRFSGLAPLDKRYVVTTRDQKELVIDTTKGELRTENIILEPSGRNTAPCVFLSLVSLLAKQTSLDEVVAIVPSDHVILNTQGFQETIRLASNVAIKEKSIVTIGINPNFPHTGFGYIERGEGSASTSFKVKSFREKPSLEVAQDYLKSGRYFWNAGMFVATLGVLLEEFKQHAPSIYNQKEQLLQAFQSQTQLDMAYNKLEAISIDYAVMEKSQKVAVCPAQFDWNDLGSWDALKSVCALDQGNAFPGKNQHRVVINSSGNTVLSSKELVVLVDTQDMVVVENEKVLMILPQSQSQKVKDVVEQLKKTPWGKSLL